MKTKICSKCKCRKSIDKFHKSKFNPDGLTFWCKTCDNNQTHDYYSKNKKVILAKAKKYRKENYDYVNLQVKKSKLKCDYGLTFEKYHQMLREQNYLCKICNLPESSISYRNNKKMNLFVDHNHETGKIRGLICNKCNRGLGFFNDNINLMKKAINYLVVND